MDRNQLPEKYKTLAIVIPPVAQTVYVKRPPAPKHLSYCKTISSCVTHCK